LCVAIIGALLFFTTQGNSFSPSNLYAEKALELIDCETPPPAEERNDSSSNNNANEEYHYEVTSLNFAAYYLLEINFHIQNSSLHSVLKQGVITPPPEFS